MEFELEPGGSSSRRKPSSREPGVFRKSALDLGQPELVPFGSILDFLDDDDPALWLLRLQQELPLSLFPAGSVSGGYDYDPRMMFTLWMLGLWSGSLSSRCLERVIRTDVRFIALAHGLRPDHSTLCRFRRSLGDSMGDLLAETVKQACEEGLVSFKRAHIDGHRLPGNVSQWTKLCQSAEVLDSQEEPKSGRRKDPDARKIITKKGFIRGYNAQALADEEAGIVLSTLVSNSSSDGALLEPVLDACLEIHGELPEALAADKGYDTPRNAYALELLGVESYIPAHLETVFTVNDEGKLVCPAGHEPSQFERFVSKGVPAVRQIVTQCKTCERWTECSKGKTKKLRRATIRCPEDVSLTAWLSMHARTASPSGRAAMKKRSSTIERTFAHTKTRLRFTRFTMRGLDLVSIEWAMLMIAYNLWRIQKAGAKSWSCTLWRFVTNLRRLEYWGLYQQNVTVNKFDRIFNSNAA